jgi:hypothetical protein
MLISVLSFSFLICVRSVWRGNNSASLVDLWLEKSELIPVKYKVLDKIENDFLILLYKNIQV